MKSVNKYKLFDPYKLGQIELKNRIVMAPLTRSRAIDNIPNQLMATYYSQRAGAGLIITEGTSPSRNGIGYPRIPGMYSDAQIEGWKKVTTEVHQMGGKIFLQLMHCGRVAHPENVPAGGEVLAPSAVALTSTQMYVDGKGELEIPVAKEMELIEVAYTIKEYAQAAKNAIKAGFDGVEVHGANGYLIGQFLNTASNKRTDEYGGSIENRTRFALEVTQEVISAIGADKVGIRLSPYGVMNEMEISDDVVETYQYLTTQLNRINVAYIHLVDHESMGAPTFSKSLKQHIRTIYNGTIILSGGYDKETAERDLQDEIGDLVAFGRPFIANPDLVGRFTENAPLAIPDADTFYTTGEEGYIDYPYMKAEATL